MAPLQVEHQGQHLLVEAAGEGSGVDEEPPGEVRLVAGLELQVEELFGPLVLDLVDEVHPLGGQVNLDVLDGAEQADRAVGEGEPQEGVGVVAGQNLEHPVEVALVYHRDSISWISGGTGRPNRWASCWYSDR